MPSKSLCALAFALSGLVSTNAAPLTLLRRVPSSAVYVAPTSAAAPSQVAPASYVPAPSATPSAAPVPSVQPSAQPSQKPSAPPASSPPASPSPTPSSPPTTAAPTSTTASPSPTPTETWSIVLDVGSSQFNIGDYDASGVESVWNGACGANGCDGGSPQGFTYNGIDGGFVESMNGQFVMTGNVDNNQDWTNSLLGAINAAWQSTIQCSSQPAESCALKKRESGPVALDCSDTHVNQCTAVNYIQATYYDSDSNQKAQITMQGSSEPDSAFPCDSLLGTINAAATAFEVDPPVAGALAFIQVLCDAIEG